MKPQQFNKSNADAKTCIPSTNKQLNTTIATSKMAAAIVQQYIPSKNKSTQFHCALVVMSRVDGIQNQIIIDDVGIEDKKWLKQIQEMIQNKILPNTNYEMNKDIFIKSNKATMDNNDGGLCLIYCISLIFLLAKIIYYQHGNEQGEIDVEKIMKKNNECRK